MTIRKARLSDVKAIHGILSTYAARGILLGRSLSDLYTQIRDFYVTQEDAGGEVVGVCCLRICWEDIAEIRSLAIHGDFHGRAMGKALVEASIQEARSMGLKKVFVLTYVPGFFKHLGFKPVDKSVLPHKVWSDCINCIKFPDCDEEALLLDL